MGEEMTECFKAIKTNIFIGILIVCIFVIFAPKILSEESNNNLIIDVTPKQVYKETTLDKELRLILNWRILEMKG